MRIDEQLNPKLIQTLHATIKAVSPSSGFQVGHDPSPLNLIWVGHINNDCRVVDIDPDFLNNPSELLALLPRLTTHNVIIHIHPESDLTPRKNDRLLASHLEKRNVGFFLVDKELQNIRILVPPLPQGGKNNIDATLLTGLLEAQGELAEHLGSYETRPGQIELLRRITEAFNNEKTLIAEAGTGVGKSLAYLLPALLWIEKNKGRVLVSTATIALQQQLLEKDIPLAKKLVPGDAKIALVKGRKNYLCLKRFRECQENTPLFSADKERNRLQDWIGNTQDGSLADLPFKPSDTLWAQVRCESDNCPASLCPDYGACFFMRARRKASEASLLVVNHHLLFADLLTRLEEKKHDEAAILPSYQSIILDEAHHAEASASSLFTKTLSLPEIIGLFNRLHGKKKGRISGLLPRLAQQFPDCREELLTQLPSCMEQAREIAKKFDALGQAFLLGKPQKRLKEEDDKQEYSPFLLPLEALSAALKKIRSILIDSLKKSDITEKDETVKSLLKEAMQACEILQKLSTIADAFLQQKEHRDQIFWLESRGRSQTKQYLSCHQTPLELNQVMKEALWNPYATVIALSATLSLHGNFDYWRERVGANELPEAPLEGLFPSPFDFSSRVFLGLPSNAPLPEDKIAWENFLVKAVSESIALVGGHALILFTSYETLGLTLKGVRRHFAQEDLQILAQGEQERSQLLLRFRQDSKSVLFGTDSFWEGVDVPGDALRLVVITRLPFLPPFDPVSQARCESIESKGGNAFMQLSLPVALIRFRQGFGRLMRHSTDGGAVLVLDSRLLHKHYGSFFLQALPPTPKSVKPFNDVLRDLENFLFP